MTLTITPASPSLYAGDPLLVKVVLQNPSKAPVVLSAAFDAGWGGVRFEVRAPGGKAFERVLALGEGTLCGKHYKVEVPAGGSIVCYERLFLVRGSKIAIFPAPGKWQIRALITLGGEAIASEPTAVSVAAPPERVKKALEEHVYTIGGALSGWYLQEDAVKSALEARDLLEGSNAAQVVAQALTLRELTYAGSVKARQLAMTEVQRHRSDLSPIAREHFDLLTADVLLLRKEHEQVKKIVDAVPERSLHRDSLRMTISGRLAGERK